MANAFDQFDAPSKSVNTFDKFDAAPEKEKMPISDAVRPFTDVANRALVAGTLGAPVDIATTVMRPFGYKEKEPVGGSEWFGKQMEQMGLVTPTRRPGAEFAAAIAPAVITGGVGAVKGGINLAKKAKDYYSLAKGEKAEALAEALKTKLSTKAEDVIAGAEKAMQEPKAKLQQVGKAQEQLGAREPVAAARQAKREQQVEKSINELSSGTPALAEDLGSFIQSKGQSNLKSLKTTREREAITNLKDPAFDTSRGREAKGDFISTNPKSAPAFNEVVEELNTQIARTPEPYRSQLKSRFESVMGKEVPLSQGELAAQQVRSSITGEPMRTSKREPMTLDQAEFLRRMLTDKKAYEVEGFTALDVNRMTDLSKKLVQAMGEYEPRVTEYIKKYGELSAPITKALGGRGEALTNIELMTPEEVMFSADKTAATNYFLNGSQERAKRLLDLTGGKTPDLMNRIRAYFKNEVNGMNSNQVSNFISKNEGLLREFPELRKPLQNISEAKKVAETAGVAAGKRAESAATRLAGEARTAEAAIAPKEKIAEKFRIYQNQITALTPKDSINKAESLVNSLRQDKLIGDAAHRDLLTQIERIKTEYGDSAQAAQNVQLMLRKQLVYGGLKLGGLGVGAYYGLKALGQ